MAIFVIVLGVLLSAVGAYEVYVGNSFIAIERGWSAFISGSVLFTGGIVVIAIGCAIRAIGDLRRTMVSGLVFAAPSLSTADDTAVPGQPTEPTLDAPSVETRPDAVAVEQTQAAAAGEPLEPSASKRLPSTTDRGGYVSTAALDTSLAVPDLSRAEAAPEPRSRFRRERIPRSKKQDIADERPSPTEADTAPSTGFFESPDRASPSTVDPEPSLGTVLLPPPPRPDMPPQPDPARPAPLRTAEAAPAMDDWLDRSFADLDREVADLYPRASLPGAALAEPTISTVHNDVPVGETQAETTAASHDSIEHAEAGQDIENEANSSPVIGRYEADGTTYIMYADGSIEAQSEAGVYRFNSMAELKSFIES